MGELPHNGSKSLTNSDDHQFVECLLVAGPSSTSAGYITEMKPFYVKDGETLLESDEETQTAAVDWRPYYPPSQLAVKAADADLDVVIGASQSESEGEEGARSLAQRWPGLWRGRGGRRGGGTTHERGGCGTVDDDESGDEEVFPATVCGFGFPGSPSPRRSPLQHSLRTPVHSPPPRRSPLQHSPLQHSPLQHSPLQHSPLQHSPLQHSLQAPVRSPPPRRSPLQHSLQAPVHSPPPRRSPLQHSLQAPVHSPPPWRSPLQHSLLTPVHSPRPERRFTLQKCTGISPLLSVSRRSPSRSQPSASSQQRSRRPSLSSRPSRRASADSDQSTRRSSQSSRLSALPSSQSSRTSRRSSSQRSRSSLFLKRRPPRSPPPRLGSHSPERDDSSLPTFNTDELCMDEDLLPSSLSGYSSSSSSSSSSPGSTRAAQQGSRSRFPDVEVVAREINQDHLYSMMCVGDVVEVEVESGSTPPDSAVMTPDSLEESVGVDAVKDSAGAGRPYASAGLQVDFIAWKQDSTNVDAGGLVRAFTDLSVDDAMNLELAEDTLAGGDLLVHQGAEGGIGGVERVAEAEHPAEGSRSRDQDAVVEVQEPAGGTCTPDKNPTVVELEGGCALDEDSVAEVVHPAEGSRSRDQDAVVEVQEPAGGTCTPDKNPTVVELEGGCALDEDSVAEVVHPAESSRSPNQDVVVRVHEPGGGTCTPDKNLTVEVEGCCALDEGTFEINCVCNEKPVVELELLVRGSNELDEDAVLEVERAVDGFCSHNDGVVGMGHTLGESSAAGQVEDSDGRGVLEVGGDGSFSARRRRLGNSPGPGPDARSSQEERDVDSNNSLGACCSEVPGEGTLNPEGKGSISENHGSFSNQTLSLKDNVSIGASKVSIPSETEDSKDFVRGYSVIDELNESTDLFDDNLSDLLQQDESDDDLIPSQYLKMKSASNCSSGEDWVPAKMKQLSGIDSLSEIKNCSLNLMLSEEVNVCTQIQSENNQGEEFVVDIEAEAFRRFPYHEAATISQDKMRSDLLENVVPDDDAKHMSGDSKLSSENDLEQSMNSSSSPNRDIDALYLTQCSPLKRKATLKGENHPVTKKARRSWEQWYQQFKTIVVTGKEKLKAQNTHILTEEKKKGLKLFSPETDSCDLTNVVESFEMHNEPTTSSMRQSWVGKSELVNYDCQDNETQFSIEALNDQLVPEQNRIHSGCNKNTFLDLKKPLFGWSSVEPSLKVGNDFPSRDHMKTSEISRTPPVTQRPVRVGLSKRAHPKPLHTKRQWWVLSVVREICSIQ